MFNKKLLKLVLAIFSSLFLFSNCHVTKYLEEDESLIIKNKVNIHTSKTEKIENKYGLNYDLSTHIKQKPNNKLLLLFPFRLWNYYTTQDPSDTTNFSNWRRRVLAESPSLFKPEQAEANAQSMSNYLNFMGYWDAHVKIEAQDKKKGKKKKVTYHVYPEKRYFLDEDVAFSSQDSSIQKILKETASQSFLKKGEAIEGGTYKAEVQRITSLLNDNGYAYFNPYYIDQLELDTLENRISGYLQVLPYSDTANHPVYKIGEITIFPRYQARTLQDSFGTYVEYIDRVKFVTEDGKLGIHPSTLLEKISLKEGDLYKKSLVNKTYRRLGDLNFHNFVSIEQEVNPKRPDHLDFYIKLIPKKLWSIGYDVEAYSSTFTQSSSFFGSSLILNFQNRNLFGGAEILSTNVNLGVEFPRTFDKGINLLDIKIESNLQIPRLVDPFRIYRLLGSVFLNKENFKQIKENTSTLIEVSYNYVNFVTFYKYNQFNGAFGYEIRPNNTTKLTITPLGIDYLTAEADTNFQVILDQNPFLERSFNEQQFFTGFIMRNLNYTWKKNRLSRNKSWVLNTGLEFSGWEAGLVNSVFGRKNSLKLFDVPLSQFVSLNFDSRYFKYLSPSHDLAFRVNAGVVFPYGKTAEVPYVKQLFVGGPNSIRAFQIREIGPGGYRDTMINDATPFFQTGDIKMEFSMEYRFDMFSWFEGALFLDGGNIWTLSDTTRQSSRIRWKKEVDPDSGEILEDNFLKHFALGAGFGLRADFDYFIVRLDMGHPIRNNYPWPDGEHKGSYWAVHGLKDLAFNKINFNLAIGYPF